MRKMVLLTDKGVKSAKANANATNATTIKEKKAKPQLVTDGQTASVASKSNLPTQMKPTGNRVKAIVAPPTDPKAIQSIYTVLSNYARNTPVLFKSQKHIKCTKPNCKFCTDMFSHLALTPCKGHKPCVPCEGSHAWFPHPGKGLWERLKEFHDSGAQYYAKAKPRSDAMDSLAKFLTPGKIPESADGMDVTVSTAPSKRTATIMSGMTQGDSDSHYTPTNLSGYSLHSRVSKIEAQLRNKTARHSGPQAKVLKSSRAHGSAQD
jgi:hypothetical protein